MLRSMNRKIQTLAFCLAFAPTIAMATPLTHCFETIRNQSDSENASLACKGVRTEEARAAVSDCFRRAYIQSSGKIAAILCAGVRTLEEVQEVTSCYNTIYITSSSEIAAATCSLSYRLSPNSCP